MKPWQLAEARRIARKRTEQFMAENTPTVHPPKPVTIAVKRALGLPVAALFSYPMPNGTVEHRMERIA
jgi:hypothetical protein